MGVDVSTLIPHRLPIGRLADTATAIAMALNARITYGRQAEDYGFVVEGIVGEGEDFTLTEDTPGESEPPGTVYLDLTRAKLKPDDTETFNYCYIYRHCIECGTYSSHRWWSFERTVFDTEEQCYLSPYRRAIQREAAVWGATEAIHFPDSGPPGKADFIHSDKTWMKWEDLLAKTKYLLEEELTDISRAMRERLPHPDLDGRTVEIFYDDFSYMPPAPYEPEWHTAFAGNASFVGGIIQSASRQVEELTNPLKPLQRERWYSHFVAQSATDDIYDLLHGWIDPGFLLNHKGDFVALRRIALPEALKGEVDKHLSKKVPKEDYCFREHNDDYLVLHDYKLTPYLSAAKSIEAIEDKKGRRFIELLFELPPGRHNTGYYQRRSDMFGMPEIDLPADTPEAAFGKEEAIAACWKVVSSGHNKALALRYADGAMAFLTKVMNMRRDGFLQASDPESNAWHASLVMAFNVPAVAYAWNANMDSARVADSHYIHIPEMRSHMKSVLQPYLEMLMARGEKEYLAWLFSDVGFREYFLPYYEAYISLLIDAHFPMSRIMEVVPILVRVQNIPEGYR